MDIVKKQYEEKNIKIIIASHKKYQIPKDDIYMPVQVNAENSAPIDGFAKDNEGYNISKKNPQFCELTALYWAWKNLNFDYIGLVHYRRYFTAHRIIPRKENERFKIVLNKKQVEKLLKNSDVVLPKKRKYYIENLYDHYKHTLYVEPLDMTRKIISEKHPEYLDEFDKLHKRRSSHMFNMFIMKKEIMNEYCTWLFDILFELEKRCSCSQEGYDKFHSRFYGRISELLMDVWINKNNVKYTEVKVINMQKTNWNKKIARFLEAKFCNKKYEESF